MYATCLHCNKPLGANQVLETLPIGRRVAFDSAQGRLWVICRHCAKWNLVPFDTRLEAIDESERIYRETPTRYSTGEIGLARHREGLDLVRIGPAMRPEFAAWRYGEQYRKRRRKALAVGSVGVVAGATGIAIAGAAVGAVVGGASFLSFPVLTMGQSALQAFERRAWGVRVSEPERDRPVTLSRERVERTMITWETGDPTIEVAFGFSRLQDRGYLRWEGNDFRSQGRRLLASLNLFAGKQGDLDSATRLIGEHSGDLIPWLRETTKRDARIGGPNGSWRFPGNEDSGRARQLEQPYLRPAFLPNHERLAVEMWMNEDIERTWLEGELKLLEREWREADRLARIADDLALASG